MLDRVHQLTLRSVALGDDGAAQTDSPALRTLVATGLVERRPDGGVAITAAGRIALEDDEPIGASSTLVPSVLISLLAVVVIFVVANLVRGDSLLTELQLTSLLIVAVFAALVVSHLRRAARRGTRASGPEAR